MMIQNSGPYYPIGPTLGKQVSDKLELSTSSTDPASGYGAYRKWGVDGSPENPDFLQGYSNKTYGEVDFVNVGSGDLDVFIELSSESPGGGGRFHIYKNQTATSTIKFVYNYWTTTDNTNTLSIGSSITDANLYKTYRVEIYDQRQNTNNPSRHDFEWKAVIDGVVILESMSGVTRNYPALTLTTVRTVPEYWCGRPTFSIRHLGVPFPYTTPTTTWDNLKISVNGDESC